MLESFLIAAGSYGGNYLRSFWPGHHAGAPLRGRRLLFLALFPLFLAVQLLHWLALALDEVLYPAYRRQRLERPVFITGIPRSGTTALHRLLAASGAFTTVSTWEALFAPAICQRTLLRFLGRLDRRIGAPLGRGLDRLLARATGGLDSVHAVSLDDAEEDYLCLLPAAGCFLLLMAFPFDRDLEHLGTPARLSPRRRNALLAFYHRLLQRHVYSHGGRRLLSKNAAFAGWPPYLAARYPEAAFVLCVRRPETALASQLSALRPARRAFGTDPDGRETTRRFHRLYAAFLADLERFARSAPAVARVVEQADLRAEPAAVVAALGHWLDFTPGLLDAAAQAAGHRYAAADFGLDSDAVARDLAAPYEALLTGPARLRVAA